MTLKRALFVVLLGVSGTSLAADDTRARLTAVITHPVTPSHGLAQAVGLDRVLVQFGETIAASPRQHGIGDDRFLEAWEATALTAFTNEGLTGRLETALAGSLSGDDVHGVDRFLASDFGRRITMLERASQQIAADQQIAALARGKSLYLGLSVHRRAQFEELLELSGADLTFAVVGESLRGMALGMHLSKRGDIETPWEEIEAEVALQLGGIKESLTDAARATLALTYEDLTDSELDTYLAFLRTPAAQRFYRAATLTVGEIIRETMFGLGQDVALRLQRVDI